MRRFCLVPFTLAAVCLLPAQHVQHQLKKRLPQPLGKAKNRRPC